MNTNQQAGNTSAHSNIWDELELNQTESGRDVERFLAGDGYRLDKLTELLASASGEASASASVALGCQTPAAMAGLWGEVAATSSDGGLLSGAGAPSGGIDIPIDLEEDASWATSPTSDTVASASPFFDTSICLEEDTMWALPLQVSTVNAALRREKLTIHQLAASGFPRDEDVPVSAALQLQRKLTVHEQTPPGPSEANNAPLAECPPIPESAAEGKHEASAGEESREDVEACRGPASALLSMLTLFQMLRSDGDHDVLPGPSEAIDAPAERLRLPELDTEVQYEVAADAESGDDVEDKGLVDAWRRKHINGVHQHDRWIFDKPAAQPGCEERAKLARAAAAQQQQDVGQESSVGKSKTTAKSATGSRGPHPYRRA
ncbi:hypothetical protein AURDEDRAFT_129603 [Auricularia subglabra TFB-10046 SS5]|uniref:Uncharacterized protein n=1 Tax=Auricularia subglabra (strain TFB-10046 / SS5) TaxID=717982 RepID=J0CZP4_AURST|nr:hypothetical protein AURDEDRAFT_129603 [Auricularia subglabra TFB-10046 SS5]